MKELIRVRVQYASRQRCCKTHKWPFNLFLCQYIMLCFIFLQAQMPDPKTYKQHFENKHPKSELPDDLKEIAL